MMVKRAPIETYCEKKISTLQKNAIGMIDYVDISSVDNTKKKIISFQTMDAKDTPSRAKQLLKKDDIIVSTVRPNLNAVAVVESETDNLMVGSTGYCVLRCKDNMDFRYLFNFCQSQYFIDDMSSQATGASYPAVSTAIVRSSLIPCYPVDEQRKIASELDKVTDLIDKRKEQLSKLDELVKARFVELFGDVKTNKFGWEKCRFGDVATKITDGEHGTVPRVEKGVGYLYFMARNITKDGNIDLTETSYVHEGVHRKIYKRCNPEIGDILLVCVGATIGKCTIVPKDFEEFSMARSVALIKPNSQKVNSTFLISLLKSDAIQNDISNCAHAAAQAGLYTNMIINLDAFLPPIELQNQFAAFVEQIDKSKLEVQKSLEKLELLKKALMQKYFG